MRIAAPATARQIDLGLAVLRAVLGVVFVAHGAQKLFVYGLAGVAGSFGQMGVPLAGIVGPAVAFVEFLGGLAVLAGFATRLAAAGVGLTMLGAMFLVHLPNGFFAPNGVEFVLSLFAMAATLVLTGAGAWSVDAQLLARGATARAQDPRSLRRAA